MLGYAFPHGQAGSEWIQEMKGSDPAVSLEMQESSQ